MSAPDASLEDEVPTFSVDGDGVCSVLPSTEPASQP